MPNDTPPTLNTHELHFWLEELRAGRPDAAEKTFRKILARVERLATAMFKKFPRIGRFVDIDDVTQNSLMRLLAAFRDIRPANTREFYALANTVIRRELLDLAKKYYGPRGHGTNVSELAVGGGDGEFEPAAADTADLEKLAAFHTAIETLPAEEREVIGLVYYHGWPQAQIAELFGVSVRTVQRWQESGFAKLRAALPAG